MSILNGLLVINPKPYTVNPKSIAPLTLSTRLAEGVCDYSRAWLQLKGLEFRLRSNLDLGSCISKPSVYHLNLSRIRTY